MRKDLIAWQQEDGSWLLKGWVAESGGEDRGYSTAFALIALQVPESRLSIHRSTAGYRQSCRRQ